MRTNLVISILLLIICLACSKDLEIENNNLIMKVPYRITVNNLYECLFEYDDNMDLISVIEKKQDETIQHIKLTYRNDEIIRINKFYDNKCIEYKIFKTQYGVCVLSDFESWKIEQSNNYPVKIIINNIDSILVKYDDNKNPINICYYNSGTIEKTIINTYDHEIGYESLLNIPKWLFFFLDYNQGQYNFNNNLICSVCSYNNNDSKVKFELFYSDFYPIVINYRINAQTHFTKKINYILRNDLY